MDRAGSQDLHSGQRNVTSDDTWGLYFAGHYVFTAVIDDLVVHHGLAQAAEIILTGESAGGIGTWYHMDDLAVQFSSARVAGAPIAGFYFFADPYQGVNHTQSELADFREAAWPSHFELWHPHVDAGCAEHYGSDNAWMCMLSNQSFPFISTPVFVTEAQTDQVVILGHDWIPAQYIYEPPEQQYVAEWAANMSAALKPVMESPKDGVFNPACFIHTSFSMGSPIIANLSYIETFGNWYFRRSGPKQLEDNCGIFCNPSCNPPAQ